MDNPMECSVCFNKYNDNERRPRTLQCGHCFCTLCVTDLMMAGQVTCPTCRASHQANNVSQIPICYGVEALLKLMKVSEPTQTLPSAAGVREGSRKKQITCISRSLQYLLKEHKDSTEGLMTGLEEDQLQLDQYCQQLACWATEHLVQLDILSDLMEQHKAAMQLIRQESNRVMAIKQQGEEEKKHLMAAMESLQAVNTTHEVVTAIDQSDRCIEEAEEWKEICKDLPNINMVNTSWKVRGDTRAAHEALSEHKSADQDGNRLDCISPGQEGHSLTIMDKVNKLTQESPTALVDDTRMVLEGGAAVYGAQQDQDHNGLQVDDIRMVLEGGAAVYGVQQDQGGLCCSRITLHEGNVYLHCLLDQAPPLQARTLPISEVLRFVDRSSTVTFLDLAWGGSTRGRVHIRLRPNNTLATQFMLLCTGEHKHSYMDTKLLEVARKGSPGEGVFGGDYQYNTGEGGEPLLTHNVEPHQELYRPGTVRAGHGPNSNRSAQFTITTRDYSGVCYYVFGNVESGLEVVRAAVHNTDIKQVTVVDCGVVLSL